MTPDALLRRYFTVEMTRDIDAILDLYTHDATFRTPERTRAGREEIRPFYEDAAARFPDLDVQVLTSFAKGEWAVVEWDARMRGPEAGEFALAGVNVARFEDERLAEVRSYYDTGTYLR